MNVKTRVAPSPTGTIHLGTAYQALLDYAFAKKNKGTFLLRVEDTDRNRYVEGAVEAIYEGLSWLGLEPDESLKQSERLEIYQRHAEQLVEQGDAYYCFCSPDRLEKVREEQRKKKLPPKYDRKCRSLSLKEAKERIAAGEKPVIRMKIPDNEKIVVTDLIRGKVEFESNLLDDSVLLKADGFPTYHLAAVVDDHLTGITHVVRGQEWLPSFPKHFLLYRYFGWKIPVFLHTPVILDPQGGKLSKRKGHTSLSWYREQGFLPEALLNYLGSMGWTHPEEKEIFSLDEFIKTFDLVDVSPISPTFDIVKLEWMNGMYIRGLNDKELARRLKPFLTKMNDDQVSLVAPLIKERIKKLSEAMELLEFVWQVSDYDGNLLLVKGLKKEEVSGMLTGAREIIEKKGVDNVESIQESCLELIKEKNWNTGAFFMALRIAVCGKKITPPIIESLSLIGKDEALKRIDTALKKLS